MTDRGSLVDPVLAFCAPGAYSSATFAFREWSLLLRIKPPTLTMMSTPTVWGISG